MFMRAYEKFHEIAPLVQTLLEGELCYYFMEGKYFAITNVRKRTSG